MTPVKHLILLLGVPGSYGLFLIELFINLFVFLALNNILKLIKHTKFNHDGKIYKCEKCWKDILEGENTRT